MVEKQGRSLISLFFNLSLAASSTLSVHCLGLLMRVQFQKLFLFSWWVHVGAGIVSFPAHREDENQPRCLLQEAKGKEKQ